jgi:hypothetical protein
MERGERKSRERAELGRRLAASARYLVFASDGRHVGVVDHIRYEQHADYPNEIVVRRRNVLLRRGGRFPSTRSTRSIRVSAR